VPTSFGSDSLAGSQAERSADAAQARGRTFAARDVAHYVRAARSTASRLRRPTRSRWRSRSGGRREAWRCRGKTKGGPILRAMTLEDNKNVVRRFIHEGVIGGNLALIDELCSPDCINHAAMPGARHGTEGLKRVVGFSRAAKI
jgi:hypothetical protein